MKLSPLVSALVVCVLVFIAATELQAQKKVKKEAIAWSAADIKWLEMKGGPPGVMYVNLWGDVMKGAHGAFVKLPAGMKNPLHTHTNTLKLVVISGTFSYTPEGGAQKLLGPGSYLYEPGGVRHTSGTVEGSECVVFQESAGKFDQVPAEPMKAK